MAAAGEPGEPQPVIAPMTGWHKKSSRYWYRPNPKHQDSVFIPIMQSNPGNFIRPTWKH